MILGVFVFLGACPSLLAKDGRSLCQEGGGGALERREVVTGLFLTGNALPDRVELLYRNSDAVPGLARLLINDKNPVMAMTDRLILEFVGPVRVNAILHIFQVGGHEDPAIDVRELGGGAWLVIVPPGSAIPQGLTDDEKLVYPRAPALAWVSSLKQRLSALKEIPQGDFALRSASIDRLFPVSGITKTSPPAFPPDCLVRQGSIGLADTTPQVWWLHPYAVAVVDSGIAQHSSLKEISWQDAVDTSKPGPLLVGSVATKPCEIACDLHGHGTRVAGGVGSTKFGVAPNTALVPIKVFDEDGCGTSDSVVAGIYQAAKKSSIAILAWTFSAADRPTCAGGTQNPSLVDPICNSIKSSPNVLFVAAAGNEDKDLGTDPSYPAGWATEVPNLLVVGGVTSEDIWFSNRGAKLIDVAGVADHCEMTIPGDNITLNEDGGTSLASGFVAGAAALYWAKNPTAKVKDVMGALRQSARLYSTNTYTSCCKNCGVLDVAKVLGGIATKVKVSKAACTPLP